MNSSLTGPALPALAAVWMVCCDCSTLLLLSQKPCLIPPRQPQSLSVLQLHDVVAVEVRLHLFDRVDVDDAGAVDTREALRIEPPFEVHQGPADQMRSVGGVNAHVVPLGGQMKHVVRGHEEEAVSV